MLKQFFISSANVLLKVLPWIAVEIFMMSAIEQRLASDKNPALPPLS